MTDKQEIVAYNEFRAQLSELREYNASVVFDYESTKGNKDARSHIHKLRKTRAAVETCRKKEKAASLEYGRRVDSEAKEIAGEIEEMIAVHHAPILAIEQREKQRIADIQEHIEYIRSCSSESAGLDAAAIEARLDELQAVEVTQDLCAEFMEAAVTAKTEGIAALTEQLAEQQKIEAEREELEKLRREAEKRAQQDREAAIAKQAAERAKQEAEQAAKQEQERAARLAEQALREVERLKLEAKASAERAANAEREAAERQARETEAKAQAEAKEKAEREADRAHRGNIHRAAIAGLQAAVKDLTDDQAKSVIRAVVRGHVPNVSIRY